MGLRGAAANDVKLRHLSPSRLAFASRTPRFEEQHHTRCVEQAVSGGTLQTHILWTQPSSCNAANSKSGGRLPLIRSMRRRVASEPTQPVQVLSNEAFKGATSKTMHSRDDSWLRREHAQAPALSPDGRSAAPRCHMSPTLSTQNESRRAVNDVRRNSRCATSWALGPRPRQSNRSGPGSAKTCRRARDLRAPRDKRSVGGCGDWAATVHTKVVGIPAAAAGGVEAGRFFGILPLSVALPRAKAPSRAVRTKRKENIDARRGGAGRRSDNEEHKREGKQATPETARARLRRMRAPSARTPPRGSVELAGATFACHCEDNAFWAPLVHSFCSHRPRPAASLAKHPGNQLSQSRVSLLRQHRLHLRCRCWALCRGTWSRELQDMPIKLLG